MRWIVSSVQIYQLQLHAKKLKSYEKDSFNFIKKSMASKMYQITAI